ncbi:hypothetical protein PanWU01x14_256920 [Parasponia andersonii]|uniref:Uncharacterized protein n=1 Tax=Parasponia andersonii TaxID=3476 RepID=A0A2P5BA85_PARAD|nr:hypothetical protein PanWU01x14_256920 [Parasponia andersonii]
MTASSLGFRYCITSFRDITPVLINQDKTVLTPTENHLPSLKCIPPLTRFGSNLQLRFWLLSFLLALDLQAFFLEVYLAVLGLKSLFFIIAETNKSSSSIWHLDFFFTILESL